MDPATIPENRLFNDLSYLWPVMSPPEEYAEEAACWRRLLWDLLGPERHHVLELGVGGGHNLSHLTPDFDGTAVDISPSMLKHSMALNPTIDHRVGDMRHVRLGSTFEAVLIHDAINCMTTGRDLAAALTTAAVHLEPGGALILAPEYFPEDITLPRVECHTNVRDDLELTWLEYTHDPDPGDASLEVLFTYYIRTGGRLSIEHDRIEVGLFSRSTWRRLLHEAGFDSSEHTFHLNEAGIDYTLLVGTLR